MQNNSELNAVFIGSSRMGKTTLIKKLKESIEKNSVDRRFDLKFFELHLRLDQESEWSYNENRRFFSQFFYH